jgi:hypothetical protein
MEKTYTVLIIEDHQIIIDAYLNALNYLKESLVDIDFNITQAKNCDEGLKKAT